MYVSVKRSALPPRKKPLKRSRVKPRRTVKRFAKHRCPELLAWIRQQVCCASRYTIRNVATKDWCDVCPPLRWSVEPAHLKTRGTGGDDRNNVVPLCPKHHDEQEGKTATFQSKYGVDLMALAVAYTRRFEVETGFVA